VSEGTAHRSCFAPEGLITADDLLLLGEAAEEAIWFPLRAVIGISDTQRQLFQDGIKLCRGREVDRLAQVI
jgi:hypothetical protein